MNSFYWFQTVEKIILDRLWRRPSPSNRSSYCLMRLGVSSSKVMERLPVKRRKLFSVLVYMPEVL